MIITIEETSNLAFPVGCPVLHFSEEEGRVILSTVKAVQLDLSSTRENLILLEQNSKRFPERLIQYAPSCPVWFQNGSRKEKAVILSSSHSSGRHLKDLNYSLKTISPRAFSVSGRAPASDDSVHNGVNPAKLSFRGNESSQSEATTTSATSQTGGPPSPANIEITTKGSLPSRLDTTIPEAVVSTTEQSVLPSRLITAIPEAIDSLTEQSGIQKASPRDVVDFALQDASHCYKRPCRTPLRNNHKRRALSDVESTVALTFLEFPGWKKLERVQKILNPETLREIEKLSGCTKAIVRGRNEIEFAGLAELLGEDNSFEMLPNEAIELMFVADDEARNIHAGDIALSFFKHQMNSSEFNQLTNNMRTRTIDRRVQHGQDRPSKKYQSPNSLELTKQKRPRAEVPPVIEINPREQETGSPFSESVATQCVQSDHQSSPVRRSIKLHLWISDFVTLADLEEMRRTTWQQVDGSVELNFVNESDFSVSIESGYAEIADSAVKKCQDDILRKLPFRFRGQLLFHWALDRDERLWTQWHKDFYSVVTVQQRSVNDPSKVVFMTVISVEGSKTGYIVGSGGGTLKKIEKLLDCRILVVGNNHTKHPFVHMESADKRNLERACNRILELISSAGRHRSKTKPHKDEVIIERFSKDAQPNGSGQTIELACGYYGPQADDAGSSRRDGALGSFSMKPFTPPPSSGHHQRFRDLFLPRWYFSNATAATIANDRARLESTTSCGVMVEISPQSHEYPIQLRLDAGESRLLTEGVDKIEKYCLDLITTSNVDCAQENLVHLQNRLLYEFAAQRDFLLGVKTPWVVRQKMIVRNKFELVYGLVVLLRARDPKEVGAILGQRGSFHKKMQKDFNSRVCIVDHASFHSPFCFISGQQVDDVQLTARRIDELLAARRGNSRRRDASSAVSVSTR